MQLWCLLKINIYLVYKQILFIKLKLYYLFYKLSTKYLNHTNVKYNNNKIN